MKTPKGSGDEMLEPWPERRRRAEAVVSRLRERPRDENARRTALAAAEDPKWEVRKVIAESIANLPDDLAKELESLLLNDSNALVQAAARKSLERRSPASGIASSAPGVIQGALEKIELKFGPEARASALKLAEKFVELHLRSAVHDVKNVLTHFNLNVEELIEALPNEAAKARVRRFENGRNYLEGLVAMMKKYSEDLSIRKTNESILDILNESVASAVDQLRSQGRNTDSVTCVVNSRSDLMVSVSRFHLSMVVTNLAKNGIESHAVSSEEMRPGTVELSAESEGDRIVIRVRDTGKGIAQGDLIKLREFIPGGSSKRRGSNRTGMGSGYGLPICRRYVDAHGGAMVIESEEGAGTCVTVRLPAPIPQETES